ncbi:hypothetical protein [Streptomyces sp. cmx-4-9]|uniref:hypothetical protein n=1 Tax=Streptomyces sp. cmx-4-9 TaxID=2790941 RepID=UPI003980AD7E
MQPEQTTADQRKEGESGRDSDTPDLPAAAGPAPGPEPTPEPGQPPAPEPATADADTAAPAAEPAAEPAAVPADVPADVPAPAARRRSRARTPLLIAAAAVLGVLAGTVTGYAVQYDRDPTPLPPLAQQDVAAPKPIAPDDATTHRTINANRWHKSDDDLTRLLIEAPSGAKLQGVGYDTPDSLATTFERPDLALRSLTKSGFRRMAMATWTQDDRVVVEVRLLQFADFEGADDYLREQSGYMPEKEFAGNDGVAVPGVPDTLGHVWVDAELDEEPGYYPTREARALIRRGDIVVDLFYHDNRGKIAESDVIDLATKQLERL